MNIRTLLSGGVIAAAGLAITAPAGRATLTYNDGDLLLGFHATGNQGASTDYVLDIGRFVNFIPGGSFALNPGATVTLSLGNVGLDLGTTYGDGTSGSTLWSTRSDLYWGVAGVQKASGNGVTPNTLFATNLEVITGVQSTPWNRPSVSASGTPATKLQAEGTAYASGTSTSVGLDQTQSTNSSVGLFQQSDSVNNYASFQTTTGQAYGYFGGGIEGTFATGTSNSVLDLYELKAGSGTGAFLGTLQMTNGGNVTFTSAVPEPSTFAALAIGVGVLASMRRRRTA